MSSRPESTALRALVSVSDKSQILEFAQGLVAQGCEIYSTGGTARHLMAAGIPVIDVAEYTQFPEMMDGRVKTLHPKIFGGILGRSHVEEDRAAQSQHGMVRFSIVCVNLYPFRETIANPQATLADAVENIDIGGPSLIRAAAKNHAEVAVVTSPQQYSTVLAELKSHGKVSLTLRQELMAAAFRHTAEYDRWIADYFSAQYSSSQDSSAQLAGISAESAAVDALPPVWSGTAHLQDVLRHGENSHQLGGLYRWTNATGTSVVTARQLNGKQLSYNNYLDMDAALAIVRLLEQPAFAVLKHNNPCGAATHPDLATACQRAFAGDPLSAFGSVIACNRTVDVATAQYLAETKGLFVEVIVAPNFAPAALEILQTRPKWKTNVRLMEVGPLTAQQPTWEVRSIAGGALIQSSDNQPNATAEWRVVTAQPVPAALQAELEFAWNLVRFVKSNAIAVAREHSLVGVGAGQMSRVDSVRIALEKAGPRAQDAVLASDAFFPFPDSVPLAAAAGIAAIIQPGGSVNDPQVIEAANAAGIPMIFTGRRHFKH